jgi:hypothetical protein
VPATDQVKSTRRAARRACLDEREHLRRGDRPREAPVGVDDDAPPAGR